MSPAEARAAWVAALRSGDYTQAHGALHRTDYRAGFCCLGVACDLYQRHVGGLDVDERDGEVHYDGNGGTLPEPVRRWVGLADSAGRFASTSLTVRNDSGATFDTIADHIESEPIGLLKGD